MNVVRVSDCSSSFALALRASKGMLFDPCKSEGFAFRGRAGGGAIPKFTHRLEESGSLDWERGEIRALLSIGAAGRGPVLTVITNNRANRELAICALRSIGLSETDAGPGIPSLP